MPRSRRFDFPIEEVAMFLFFIFAIVTISLPFLALFIQSKGFKWMLVIILIWISAGYLASKAGEEAEGQLVMFSRKKKQTPPPDELARATELLSRGEIGFVLSQDVVYDRLASMVRKGLVTREVAEKDFIASTDAGTGVLRELLKHEKRKGSFSFVKRLGLNRDKDFIHRVSDRVDVIERWSNEDI
jgi:DNA-binding PadR family transcriptional regulator